MCSATSRYPAIAPLQCDLTPQSSLSRFKEETPLLDSDALAQAQEERERAEEDARGEGYVEVHGMVWHVHERCRGEGRVPVSRAKGYGTM